ncbi:hypothetical protein BST81_23830 [Leptolyngbya sp. 'hensonii']|uniref:sensor histidine kinase n=1 Tax=Leptolyngbya sp. 'hensonii' TaxID=1922337 RepID=UPI00094FB4E7|nr:ATP-binding protein [Leptolyngbya sp. 'hensonii']OLP15860.1 hypothetical protein BST81_23830 [Leptolyngbya sp. 'hensonii']
MFQLFTIGALVIVLTYCTIGLQGRANSTILLYLGMLSLAITSGLLTFPRMLHPLTSPEQTSQRPADPEWTFEINRPNRSDEMQIQEEFISIVSHELRTPLTAIQGALELLDSGLVDPSSNRGQQVIKIAVKGADRLSRLVNDMLDLDGLDSGRLRLDKQICNTLEIATTAVEQMQTIAAAQAVQLTVAVAGIPIEADHDRLLQVLTNLLSNAIKFSPPDSEVWVTATLLNSTESQRIRKSGSASPASAHVLFSVKDKGRGIPADKLETIFERFNQVDASNSRQKGGTGLGLAICRSIVQQHGGRIWAESILGEGSTFYWMLPQFQPRSSLLPGPPSQEGLEQPAVRGQ